ncbi:hypothetical protein MKW94_017816 [Papaver nudicaule]|uniref:peptidylprolyl isomerase n=1 Tax=Papaver nudicaule TaxID=74823 RepID=A0AA41SHK6_PAPNU|nr:hypothetical protein [Papaver nudicaule]
MTFWGVEVDSSDNAMICRDKSKGRLHISRATLGKGRNTNRCIVLCSVGGEPPVFLCSLRAETNESCELDLDFDEDTVVFLSVDGPLTVHLTGYYREKRKNKDGDESETQEED